MHLSQKQYFAFKLLQLILAFIIVTATIILVALPQTTFTINEGIELLVAYAGVSFIANGVTGQKTKNNEVQNGKSKQ